MPETRYVLAIDLGTSRLKAAVIDEHLNVRSRARRSYETISHSRGMAEQRPRDWLDALRDAARDAIHAGPGAEISAVVLTAQMPTLVALSRDAEPIGNAVTWQDARADALVLERLGPSERQRVRSLAGTPIDGRYLIPMHLRRRGEPGYEPATILSAKDFLYFVLTGQLVTDPSTASGYGNYSLESENWSDELSALWSIERELLPEVVASTFVAPLSVNGSALLGDVVEGTPVVVGGADSVCAHHFITGAFPGAVSIIDGSSTVIMATLEKGAMVPADVLITPLVDASQVGVELDLLATGSTVGWLAALFDVTALTLEELALGHPNPANTDTMFFPYLAGGEQGALWLSALAGSIRGISRSTTRADIALAAFEGIAFETLRCLQLDVVAGTSRTLVSVASPGARHFGAALLSALGEYEVRALSHESPSLMGAAMLAHELLNVSVMLPSSETGELPLLGAAYRTSLPAKAARYLAVVPDQARKESKHER